MLFNKVETLYSSSAIGNLINTLITLLLLLTPHLLHLFLLPLYYLLLLLIFSSSFTFSLLLFFSSPSYYWPTRCVEFSTYFTSQYVSLSVSQYNMQHALLYDKYWGPFKNMSTCKVKSKHVLGTIQTAERRDPSLLYLLVEAGLPGSKSPLRT